MTVEVRAPVHDGVAPAEIVNPCRRCGGERDILSPDRGLYAKLCADCRSITASERKTKNTNQPGSRIDLPKVVRKAEGTARRLQKAIEQRHASRMEAQAAVLAFNESLREIQEAARAMMNGHVGGHERIERELAAVAEARDEE